MTVNKYPHISVEPFVIGKPWYLLGRFVDPQGVDTESADCCPATRAAILLDAGHNLPEGVSLFDVHHGKHSTLFFLQTPRERITIPIENGDNLVARFHKLLEDTMKGKEIGMKKSASKAAKAYDEKMDKKKGYAEGSKADIKADKAAMKKFPAKKKGK